MAAVRLSGVNDDAHELILVVLCIWKLRTLGVAVFAHVQFVGEGDVVIQLHRAYVLDAVVEAAEAENQHGRKLLKGGGLHGRDSVPRDATAVVWNILFLAEEV